MNSQEYWDKREKEHIKKRIKDDKVRIKKLQLNYMRAYKEVSDRINAFYAKYASERGISIVEARKRAAKMDVKAFQTKAKKYVKERNFTKKANEELRLYNLTMKTSRLELLKNEIRLEIIALYSDEERFIGEELSKTVIEEFKRQSGILGITLNHNAKKIQSIVDSSFHTANWSERIWGEHQDILRHEVERLVNNGMIQGKNPREQARRLKKIFDTSTYNAERLMITEMARAQGDVFKDSMEQGGFTQYKFLAEPTACKICKELDNKIFDIKDMKVGTNMYPMHPNCHCTTSNYMSREKWEKDLERRGL